MCDRHALWMHAHYRCYGLTSTAEGFHLFSTTSPLDRVDFLSVPNDCELLLVWTDV